MGLRHSGRLKILSRELQVGAIPLRIISHRGNLSGPDKSTENSSKQVDLVLSLGLECEIDVWYVNGEMLLGHDSPKEMVSLEWLDSRSSKLWIHCKNLESLDYFSSTSSKLNYFWHQTDDYSLTSLGYIWTYPGKPLSPMSILVLPELYSDLSEESLHLDDRKLYGICSDYVSKVL